MSLIQHYDGIRVYVGIKQAFTLQHTICHILDLRFRACAIFKTDSITNFLPEATSNLLSYTFCDGHCGNTTGLCATDLSSFGITFLGKILSHLSCLSRSRIANNNQDLMLE